MQKFNPDDIDPEILDIITDINDVGAKTEYCCAGYGPHSKNDLKAAPNRKITKLSHGVAYLAFKEYHPFLEKLIDLCAKENYEYTPWDENAFHPMYTFHLRDPLPYEQWSQEKKDFWKENRESLCKDVWDKIRDIISKYKNAQQ